MSNLTETQTDLLNYLSSLTCKLQADQLDAFTTQAISRELLISRNLASQHLNAFVRSGLVVKAGAHPVYYFHKRSLERLFQERIEQDTYPSVEALFALSDAWKEKGFSRAIGHDLSLAPCIEQCCAALHYPGHGLPILLVGPVGVGKGFMSRLMFEYALDAGLLPKDSSYLELDAEDFVFSSRGTSAKTINAALDEILSTHKSAMLVVRNADQLDVASLDALISKQGSDDVSLRLVFATTVSLASEGANRLSRRIPIVASIPSLEERTPGEREDLVLHFLKMESRRMETDIFISRSAFAVLAHAEFKENVRELISCITNCCAEAYLSKAGERLEIQAYHLPAYILDVNSDFDNTDDEHASEFIDVTRTRASKRAGLLVQLLDQMLAAYERSKTTDGMYRELRTSLLDTMRDFGDALAFDHSGAYAKSAAYEGLLGAALEHVGQTHGITLSRRCSLLLAREICIQLRPAADLARWRGLRAPDIVELYARVSEREEIARVVTDQIAVSVAGVLGVNLDALTRLLLLLELCEELGSQVKRTSMGLVISHGYATASSIADAANRILHAHVFEAIDMTYEQQMVDIVPSLQKLLNRYAYCDEIALLVDMGALEEIYKELRLISSVTLGVVNNISTGLAVEIGSGLISGRKLNEVLEGATKACSWHYRIIERTNREPAILVCSENGLEAAENLRALVVASVNKEIPLRFVACDTHQLFDEEAVNRLLAKYDVRAIIGTFGAQLPGVCRIALEDIIAGHGSSILDEALSGYLNPEEMAALHDNLVKNITLRSVVESITILNPVKLFEEVERAVGRLQTLSGNRIENGVVIGLYVHLCCLVERLVTRTPFETYVDGDAFAREHADFLEQFYEAFSEISAHYRVKAPLAEVAYVFDYINSRNDEDTASADEDFN